MEWVNNLRGTTVGLDTAPVIYFIEEHPSYVARVAPFFESIERGELRAVTSFVTLLEALIVPLRSGRLDLARQYREIILRSRGLDTIALDAGIAEEAARLRANHKLRTADAIQLATALRYGASHFLTNDLALAQFPDISVIVLDRLPDSMA